MGKSRRWVLTPLPRHGTWDTTGMVGKRVVRILLECLLVSITFMAKFPQFQWLNLQQVSHQNLSTAIIVEEGCEMIYVKQNINDEKYSRKGTKIYKEFTMCSRWLPLQNVEIVRGFISSERWYVDKYLSYFQLNMQKGDRHDKNTCSRIDHKKKHFFNGQQSLEVREEFVSILCLLNWYQNQYIFSWVTWSS